MEPQCTGFDWTETPWVPSSLEKERLIGRCSYLSSYVEYDEQGSIEAHESWRKDYYVRPDGSALEISTVERPWGSGQIEKMEKIFPPGTWICDRWATWPRGFGARAGTRILRAKGGEK